MHNHAPAPVDTIELLLREIATQLRRRAADNRPPRRAGPLVTISLLALVGCGAGESFIPARGPGVSVMPSAPSIDESAEDKRAAAHDVTRAGHVSTVYVQRTTGCHDDPHDSTLADPYCEIAPALPAAGRVIVHLGASDQPYSPIAFTGEQPLSLEILGPGAGDAVITGSSGAAVRLRAPHGHDVFVTLRDVALTSTSQHAADCGGKSGHARLTLEDVVLRDSGGYGAFAFGCDLTIRRALVTHNGGGIAIGLSRYALEDVTLAGNRGTALFVEESEGTEVRVERQP